MNTKPQTYTLEGKHLARLAARDGITIRGTENAQRAYVRIAGWIGGDGVGSCVSDFFDDFGEYKGPDGNGLEPKWEDAPVVEYRVPLIEHGSGDLVIVQIEAPDEDDAQAYADELYPDDREMGNALTVSESRRIMEDPLIQHAPALLHTLEILLTWGRNYTSPVERNSPHALLCAAHDLIERARGRK
ncbi:MAG: hypothetical protein IT581_12255 [Verrucomicrobiales bacterium]|nr:hypothetical protein [Verrucomicrobiales bacterium]